MKVDYSRLTAVLWSVAKTQQQTITDLAARVQALENLATSKKDVSKAATRKLVPKGNQGS